MSDQHGSALDLLSGDAQTFHHKVWASRVHVHHTDPADLVGLLSLDDVDRLLTSSALRTPALRLAQDGAVISPSKFTRHATMAGTAVTGLVDGRKVLDLFEGGATVVLQGLHRYHPPLTRLVRRLELELGHPCQANAYLTPPDSQGFAVHEDTHDVFVFQTAGSKLWEVHTPDGVEEILLEPGVCLYLPTGTPHAARAQATVSLHVTIGINQLTWRGLVERTVQQVVDRVPEEHLPGGFLEDRTGLVDQLARRLEQVADDVRRLDATAAVEQEVRRGERAGVADLRLVEAEEDVFGVRGVRHRGHEQRRGEREPLHGVTVAISEASTLPSPFVVAGIWAAE